MSKKNPYITKSFRQIGSNRGKVRRYVRNGWEVVSETPLGLSGVVVITVRIKNPKYVG